MRQLEKIYEKNTTLNPAQPAKTNQEISKEKVSNEGKIELRKQIPRRQEMFHALVEAERSLKDVMGLSQVKSVNIQVNSPS